MAPHSANWGPCLANAPKPVVQHTLRATTQYCITPQPMETQGEPRQHRQKRLIPLHYRRLLGRTDTDTFFSSVTSVQKYTCGQVFTHLTSQFLFIQLMRRESQSHSAYQDFLRKVGAPDTLLTDNAKTQIGQKWTETSRSCVVKQIFTVPHNQQQNNSERSIRDIKHRTVQTLRTSKAPSTFWC